eukprot:Hpha_TRINITY_DN22809_c0_g1::TRINITY_DN22809_c0_g1_i1::g.84397::m.84397
MMEGLKKCYFSLTNWAIRPEDTVEDKNIKRWFMPPQLCVFVVCTFFLNTAVADGDLLGIISEGNTLFGLSIVPICGMLGMRMRKPLDITLVYFSFNNLLRDLRYAAALAFRSWYTVIVFLDAALIFNRPNVINVIMFVTILWRFVDAAEAGLRIGLYDAASDGDLPRACDCSEPPCAVGISNSLAGLSVSLVVLCVDFFLTRSFATDLRFQLKRVESSVEVAAGVASALARYDVDAAERAITSEMRILDELGKSLLQLIANLRSYKPYLPHSCLVPEHASPPFALPPAPSPPPTSPRRSSGQPTVAARCPTGPTDSMGGAFPARSLTGPTTTTGSEESPR